MVPLAPDEKWAYRRPAFEKVFSAVRTMLMNRMNRSIASDTALAKIAPSARSNLMVS
jgi:hypothetical protein